MLPRCFLIILVACYWSWQPRATAQDVGAQDAATLGGASFLPSFALVPYPTTQTPEPILLSLFGPVDSAPINALPAPGSETLVPPLALVPEPVEAPQAMADPLVDLDADPTGPKPDSEADSEAEPKVEPEWYRLDYWFQPSGWDSGVELGLNGSSGTSESLSMRVGGFIKRKTKSRKIDFDIYLNRTKSSGVETQQNAQANYRLEWLKRDAPWTAYIQSQLYYDAFQRFDASLNLNSGLGYRFLDEDWIELTGRFGVGGSREFGGLDDSWVPEAQFGFDFKQQISKTQKFYAKTDYFPEWEDFSRYRLLTDIGWEVELIVPSNVSLKIAATDRFDSHPGDVNPHNLNYSVLLLWKL